MTRQQTLLACLIAAFGAVLVLSGCGFRPVYAGPAYESLRGVSVSVRGEDRFAYLVESAMLERLGARDETRGTLQVGLRIRQRNLGVSADGEASRIALDVTARYSLSMPGSQRLRGQASERVAFETPREPYALISARANAERQAAETIAESILRTVAADLRRRELGGNRPETRPARRDRDDGPEVDDLLGEEDGW